MDVSNNFEFMLTDNLMTSSTFMVVVRNPSSSRYCRLWEHIVFSRLWPTSAIAFHSHATNCDHPNQS